MGEYARVQGFVLVSKDSDFYQRALLAGAPPKLVWLRIGNCTRQAMVELLIAHHSEIASLVDDPVATVLVLSPAK